MINPQEEKVPYSAEAVNKLLAIERTHLPINSKPGFPDAYCDVCFINRAYNKNLTSCPTLIEAQESASKETLIAVALILSGEKSK